MDRVDPTAGLAVPKQRGIAALFRKSESQAPSVTEQMETLGKRQPYFVAIIKRRVPGQYAEDVYQNAMEGIQKHLENGGAVENLMAFATTSCYNAAFREMEKIRRRAELLADDTSTLEQVDQAAGEAFDKVELQQLYLELRGLMAKELTRDEHEACVLVHFEGLTSGQAGDVLGKKAAAVRQALSRAKSKLDRPEFRERFGYRPEPRKAGGPTKRRVLKQEAVQSGAE